MRVTATICSVTVSNKTILAISKNSKMKFMVNFDSKKAPDYDVINAEVLKQLPNKTWLS